MCLSLKILNLFGILSSWGSSNYRPSAPFLYDVASHVINRHFDDYYYYYCVGDGFKLFLAVGQFQNQSALGDQEMIIIIIIMLVTFQAVSCCRSVPKPERPGRPGDDYYYYYYVGDVSNCFLL